MPFPANTPTVDNLPGLGLQDIAQLPVELLAILQRDVDERIKRDKAAKARLDGALTVRYATRAAEERQAVGKDTGTIRFDDGDFTVVADLPKRVDWDQDRLAAMVERIRAAGDDPAQYVDIAFKVPERKYAAWPDAIRAGFEPARTVRPWHAEDRDRPARGRSMTALAPISTQSQDLPSLIDRAASMLSGAKTAAEVLEAREVAGLAYDVAKRAARLQRAKSAHDDLVAAAHRAQAHALEIEARAKRRLADEYDAAQARGEAQRRAYRIADNKLTELGTWDEALLSAELNDLLAEDFDLSLVGFSDGELDKLLAFVPEGDGEEGGAGGSVPPVTIPEPPRNPASLTGDLWILGDHRLLCGDSTSHDDVRRLMNGERAILFATDPPYLVDYDGSNHPTRNKDWSASYGTTWDDSSQGAELYDGFIAAAVAEAIAGDAAWYCWHASRRQAMLEACWEKAGAFVHQQIIWVKDRGVLTRSHYLWKHEPCFMGWRRPNRPPKVAEETLPSTWALPSFAKDDRPDHPTPKPLDAFGIPMRQHVARGGLCYEPFSGSGSQIMAGEANGRRVFAMEISPAYVDVAVERWQAETGKDAILDGDGRTFAQVKAERLGDVTDTPDTDAEPEPARKRQTAA